MVWFTSKIGHWSESYDGLQSKLFTEYCSNPVYRYLNINTGNVAIEFIWYNSQLLVQHLYVFPWGLIDRFFGASQHNVKKRVHTGYCNLFHFANDVVHYKQTWIYLLLNQMFSLECLLNIFYVLSVFEIW